MNIIHWFLVSCFSSLSVKLWLLRCSIKQMDYNWTTEFLRIVERYWIILAERGRNKSFQVFSHVILRSIVTLSESMCKRSGRTTQISLSRKHCNAFDSDENSGINLLMNDGVDVGFNKKKKIMIQPQTITHIHKMCGSTHFVSMCVHLLILFF